MMFWEKIKNFDLNRAAQNSTAQTVREPRRARITAAVKSPRDGVNVYLNYKFICAAF